MKGDLANFVRTPRGTVMVLVASLLFSTLVAVFLATQREFFERYVREKYDEPSAMVRSLGEQLQTPKDAARVVALGPTERQQLYRAWLRYGDDWPLSAASVMVSAAPGDFLDFGFQTLIAGSHEQRQRAIVFLGRCGRVEAAGILAEARARALRRREVELASDIDRALSGARGATDEHAIRAVDGTGAVLKGER